MLRKFACELNELSEKHSAHWSNKELCFLVWCFGSNNFHPGAKLLALVKREFQKRAEQTFAWMDSLGSGSV